ncbi:MAG: hypothetical protein RMK98_09085, partial [Bacteroidia bacterium]|nr:hypothetical protein [Bacteroidia bacterium]
MLNKQLFLSVLGGVETNGLLLLLLLLCAFLSVLGGVETGEEELESLPLRHVFIGPRWSGNNPVTPS